MKKYALLPLLLLALFSGACAPGFRLIEPGDDGRRSVIVGDELVRYTAPPGYVDKTYEPSSARLTEPTFLSRSSKMLAAYDAEEHLFEFFTVTTPEEYSDMSVSPEKFALIKVVLLQSFEKKCRRPADKKRDQELFLDDCRIVTEPENYFSFAASMVSTDEGKPIAKMGYVVTVFMVKGKLLQFNYHGFIREKDGLDPFIARAKQAFAAMHFEQNPAVVAGSGGK